MHIVRTCLAATAFALLSLSANAQKTDIPDNHPNPSSSLQSAPLAARTAVLGDGWPYLEWSPGKPGAVGVWCAPGVPAAHARYFGFSFDKGVSSFEKPFTFNTCKGAKPEKLDAGTPAFLGGVLPMLVVTNDRKAEIRPAEGFELIPILTTAPDNDYAWRQIPGAHPPQ